MLWLQFTSFYMWYFLLLFSSTYFLIFIMILDLWDLGIILLFLICWLFTLWSDNKIYCIPILWNLFSLSFGDYIYLYLYLYIQSVYFQVIHFTLRVELLELQVCRKESDTWSGSGLQFFFFLSIKWWQLFGVWLCSCFIRLWRTKLQLSRFGKSSGRVNWVQWCLPF